MAFFSWWRRSKPSNARRCVLCHDSAPASDGLCAGCAGDLASAFTDPAASCPLCFGFSAGAAVCGRCQKKPPRFERLWASVYYEPPVSSMIHQFKHLADLSMLPPLAGLMMRHAPDWLYGEQIDCVLAMPLSRERRIYRGFNQSDELVSQLAAHYGWQVLPRGTVSRVHGAPQSTLKGSERLRNVKNTFSVENDVFKKRNILLIDDVVTTGSTFGELAQTLKKSGAEKVFCWSLARAQMKK